MSQPISLLKPSVHIGEEITLYGSMLLAEKPLSSTLSYKIITIDHSSEIGKWIKVTAMHYYKVICEKNVSLYLVIATLSYKSKNFSEGLLIIFTISIIFNVQNAWND